MTSCQYGGQLGYRNSPAASPVNVQSFPIGMRPPMQQVETQEYNVARYQYPRQPQHQRPLGRAMSIPSYNPSPPGRVSAQYIHSVPCSAYGTPSFLSTKSPSMFSDETSGKPTDSEYLLPRGPPRKPKQSGFALWVGNLPRDVLLEELKDFFALEGLESIFLIRKSNWAFVNYETEEACSLALSTFNDKMFKNVRLICRLRKSSPSRSSAIPSSTALSSSQTAVNTAGTPTPNIPTSPQKVIESPVIKATEDTPIPSAAVNSTPSNRYFIMKSLTKDDLAWSVANKLWVTQPHNESVLNDAFKTAENVYLIFSANKSREFFGYARMESEIEDRATMGHVKAEGVSGRLAVWDPSVVLTGPKVKTTPRTKNGPRGKIFEDEVRGTVFWEVAESSGDDEDDVNQYQPKVADTLGNTFQIEWVKWFSLFVLEPDGREVPVRFERTRLLRNPWNGNREVKISRDGTEIEPSVGARLLKEFDVELSTIGPGSRPVVRHMSYQMPPDRPTMSRPLVYQWFPPAQAAPHLLYGTVVGTPATTFNYASHQGMPQHSLRQPYGSKGQRYRIPKLANVAEGHYLF